MGSTYPRKQGNNSKSSLHLPPKLFGFPMSGNNREKESPSWQWQLALVISGKRGYCYTERAEEYVCNFLVYWDEFGICFPNVEGNWGSETAWPKKSMVTRYSDHLATRVQISERCIGASSHWPSSWEPFLYISSKLHIQWCNIGSLKLAIMKVFTSQKLANAEHQSIYLFRESQFVRTHVWIAYQVSCVDQPNWSSGERNLEWVVEKGDGKNQLQAQNQLQQWGCYPSH